MSETGLQGISYLTGVSLPGDSGLVDRCTSSSTRVNRPIPFFLDVLVLLLCLKGV